MIEVVPPTTFEALDASIELLVSPGNEVEWLIFTSANAVHAMIERVKEKGTELYPNRIAVIGPATARAVEQSGLAPRLGPILISPRFVADSLAETLLAHASTAPQNYLLVRAEDARDVVPDTLRAAGHQVTIAAAYRNITPPDTLAALHRIFDSPATYPDTITFTSSSTARNLVTLLESIGRGIPPGVALASIGPITSATLRELGYEPALEAAEPTIASLVDAIAGHLKLR